MAELSGRVAALSEQRRRLLAKLTEPVRVQDRVQDRAAARLPDGRNIGAFYDVVTDRLDATPVGPWALFLNYGYLDGTDDRSVVALPERTLDRTSVKLVLELVGDADVGGRRILDSGCGRGGTLAALLRYFAPRTVTGLDLSPAAARFCAGNQRDPRASFVIADSQRIPFADASFDIVTNVESSHCYPNVSAFYAEARRVLAPGGLFLYTDLLATSTLPARRDMLNRIGFTVEVDRDITANVLGSCDLVAARRAAAFAGDEADLRDFLAVPGSSPYKAMRSGRARYILWRLRVGA